MEELAAASQTPTTEFGKMVDLDGALILDKNSQEIIQAMPESSVFLTSASQVVEIGRKRAESRPSAAKSNPIMVESDR